MSPTDVLTATIWEDGQATVFARVRNNDGLYLTQASLSAVACAVYDRSDDDTLVTQPAVVIATSVFDTLQTSVNDARWTVDATGFNFRHTLPAACFPQGGRTYRAEYQLTPADGSGLLLIVADIKTRSRLSG